MYLDYWKFSRKPFSQLFDESLIHFRDSLAAAYHSVTLAVQLPPAVIWVCGPKGSGKTTLTNLVEHNFGDEYQVFRIKGESITSRKPLLSHIQPEIIGAAHLLPGGTRQISDILRRRIDGHPSQSMVVTIDDVDQGQADETSADLKAIAGAAGESSLELTLIATSTNASSMPEELSSTARLQLLEAAKIVECEEIILKRLRAAGGRKEIFHSSALATLAESSGGDIRKLLVFTDLCLQVGAIRQVDMIDSAFIEEHLHSYMEQVRRDKERKKETEREDLRRSKKETESEESPPAVVPRDERGIAPPETAVASGEQPESMPSHRLISQVELETYRSTSDREKKRSFVEDLQKKIAAGQINLVEAIQQFEKVKTEAPESKSEDKKTKESSTKKESKKPEAASGKSEKAKQQEEAHIAELDDEILYLRGLEVISQLLDRLREKKYTDLTNVFSLATSINRKVREDNGLVRKTFEQPTGYDLPNHLLNVGILVSACARELGLSLEQGEEITIAGLLHDIGHLHTNEDLIQSPTRFDRRDFRIIKQHPIVGRDMIIHLTNGSRRLAEIISQEHERDDGLGYPNYLSGEQIHVPAKIIAVCDTFEALSHPRSYRKALSQEESLVQIRNVMTRRTDPRIVQAIYRVVTGAMEGTAI